MALLKEIELTNGVKTKYHRISETTYVYDQATQIVCIDSYIDESKRQQEKEYFRIWREFIPVQNEIQYLIDTNADQSLIDEKQHELNHLVLPDYTPVVVEQNRIMIDTKEIITDTKELYRILKEDKLFSDAEDLL